MHVYTKLTICISLFFCQFSFAQLDSISIGANFAYYEALDQDGDTIEVKYINVETWINDFDFFGEIIVTTYHLDTNTPVNKVKFSKSEIEEDEMFENDVITIPMHYVEEGLSYKVDVLVRDNQGLHLPIVEQTVNVE